MAVMQIGNNERGNIDNIIISFFRFLLPLYRNLSSYPHHRHDNNFYRPLNTLLLQVNWHFTTFFSFNIASTIAAFCCHASLRKPIKINKRQRDTIKGSKNNFTFALKLACFHIHWVAFFI